MNENFHILLIDDDELNNYVTLKLIEKDLPNSTVTFFLDGADAIEFLLKLKSEGLPFPDAIFLDITMPIMNGWEFLDQYNRLQIDTAKHCSIYIVTISVFNRDIYRARTYPIVKEFIHKPMNTEKIRSIFKAKNITPDNAMRSNLKTSEGKT